MRTALLVPVLLALAACQSPDLTAYHHAAAHPYQLRETQLSMALGAEAELAVTRAGQFAAQRPNNGSSFVISAEPATAERVRRAVLATGVDPRDISVAPPSAAPELIRIDRFASVGNCAMTPTRLPGEHTLFNVEDGFTHNNVNSSLLGCSVRQNLAQMSDDPRSLIWAAQGVDGRDGARSADVYAKWVKGQATYTRAQLPSWSTSSISSGTGQ